MLNKINMHVCGWLTGVSKQRHKGGSRSSSLAFKKESSVPDRMHQKESSLDTEYAENGVQPSTLAMVCIRLHLV